MAPRARGVVWTHWARLALGEVLDTIAVDSPSGAKTVAAEALKAVDSLSTFADRGRVVPELADPGVRELLVLRYRLLYRVYDDRVVILAFVHGARDFETWRQERKPPLED